MATATDIYGFNIGGNNNSFDQRGHFYRAFLSGNVSGMLVKQNSTPNMTVLVEHGSALLNKNTTSASVAEVKSDTSVTIDTANTSNPRIDTVVIYEDTSVAIPTVEANYWQDGAGGRFKIVSLPGTAGAAPVALSDANIQTAIGAGKPWTRLADVTVPTNSTTIINSNIADKRSQMGGTIPDKSVTAQKIDYTTGIWWEEIGRASLSGASTTVSFTGKNYLKVLVRVAVGSPSLVVRARFNGDAGTNYGNKYNTNGSSSDELSATYISPYGAASNTDSMWEFSITNVASTIKVLSGMATIVGGGASTQMTQRVISSKWVNTSNQITSITIFGDSSGSLSGEIVVLGHN